MATEYPIDEKAREAATFMRNALAHEWGWYVRNPNMPCRGCGLTHEFVTEGCQPYLFLSEVDALEYAAALPMPSAIVEAPGPTPGPTEAAVRKAVGERPDGLPPEMPGGNV